MFRFLQRRETLETEAIRMICGVLEERNDELKASLQRITAHYYEEIDAHDKTRAVYDRTKDELAYASAEITRLNHALWEVDCKKLLTENQKEEN